MAGQENRNIRTSTLFRRLFKAPDLEAFIKNNEDVIKSPSSFHSYIDQLCVKKGLVPAQVIKQSYIERTYGHQLFNGTRNPSRDKVIQLAFGFGLDVEETQDLLRAAQKSPLYPRIKRDAAILFCISHGKGILDTQLMLNELGVTVLGGDL